MEQLNQYLPLVIAVGLAVVIVLTAIIAAGLNRLFKNIVSNKFAMADFEEVNIHTGEKTYAVIVSNKSMNDAGITAMGLVSGLKYFDFKETYKAANDVSGETLIVMPRTPVKLVLCPEEVEKLVFSNLDSGKFLPIKTYVIDSTGNIFLQRAKNLQKILKINYKAYLARVKAAKEAKGKENKLKADYEYLKSVKDGEKAGFKDKIKVVLMKKVTPEDILEAEAESEKARKFAEKYSLVNDVAVTALPEAAPENARDEEPVLQEAEEIGTEETPFEEKTEEKGSEESETDESEKECLQAEENMISAKEKEAEISEDVAGEEKADETKDDEGVISESEAAFMEKSAEDAPISEGDMTENETAEETENNAGGKESAPRENDKESSEEKEVVFSGEKKE